MKSLLYHNVRNLEILKSILKSGKILKDERLMDPCVCLSRDSRYLKDRGIQIVIERDKLRNYAKIKPFCYHGWKHVNKIPTKLKKVDEFEERAYAEIILNTCCISININRKIHPHLEISHHLIVNIWK